MPSPGADRQESGDALVQRWLERLPRRLRTPIVLVGWILAFVGFSGFTTLFNATEQHFSAETRFQRNLVELCSSIARMKMHVASKALLQDEARAQLAYEPKFES